MPDVIAWDIETCPQDADGLTPLQEHRLNKLVMRDLAKQGHTPEMAPPETVAGLSQLHSSIHPHLGWICCITVRRMDKDGSIKAPKSYSAMHPSQEKTMLAEFWEDLGALPRGPKPIWLTFNGKGFDVPFLSARTLHHGLAPTRFDLLDTYPWRQRPHCDLAKLFDRMAFSFDGLCEFLGVPSPKGRMGGKDVAKAVREGRIHDVVTYCEEDVRALLQCYQRAACAIN